MQIFRGFSGDVIAGLISDSVNKWDDSEFSMLNQKIDIESIGKNNPLVLNQIENDILMKLDAEKITEK